jgi:poly(ADP-ribose) glycohydrolase ARH3
MPRTEDRLRGALLGLALGDAVGAPFEGWPRVGGAEVDAWLDDGARLRWTDDTHMALTLAQVLDADDGALDEERLGDAFAAAFAEQPWRGYGAGPPQVFALARRGLTYREAAASLFGGSGSFGNGAAMRVAPVALVARSDLERAAELAAAQARVTHTHPEGVEGAVFVATAAAVLATSDAPVDSMPQLLRTTTERLSADPLRRALTEVLAAAPDVERLTRVARRVGTGVAARESVPAAVAALLSGHDVVSTLRAAVVLGGDTDTIAAMAGTLAGAVHGASDIPRRLLDRLEAAEQLEALASALLER